MPRPTLTGLGVLTFKHKVLNICKMCILLFFFFLPYLCLSGEGSIAGHSRQGGGILKFAV